MRSGGKAVVDSLVANGVDTVFCVPGESYIAVLDALYDAPGIRVISCRHEAAAANMAEAYGKLTGRPGICLVTRAPGATHASIGVHTAKQDSTPMILLVGQGRPRDARPRGVSGDRLRAGVRRPGEMGGTDRRRAPDPRADDPRFSPRGLRPARAGRARAARRRADCGDRRGRRSGFGGARGAGAWCG